MKILVIGSGGREHAIAKKFLESNKVEKVFVAPGNAGMTRDGIEIVPIAEKDFSKQIAFAKENAITFTFVGPEIPLIAGIADEFEKEGLLIFAPSKAAAEIEGSKDFAKQMMNKYHVPTAKHQTFTDLNLAKAYVNAQGAPIVVKADGLAAGKGVVVAETVEEAEAALVDMLEDNVFGASGARVVVEEFLEGQEFSLLSFVDGEKVYPMVISQDHKRAFDGDKGANTGGMGAYAPVPQIPEEMVAKAVEEIVKPTAKGLVAEGKSFKGILYAGLIATKQGAKVIEFNARFGDPETQVVLPRLTSDFAQIILDILEKREPVITWKKEGITLGVVVASDGYPGNYENGFALPDFSSLKESSVIFAGVSEKNGQLITNGGRVLLLEATGENVTDAREKVYQDLKKLNLEHLFYRKDIGEKALYY
ncbi:phosphoribosylamine--glycine ligase [Pilibacter termitis]|uniref:Phosphoribosylamine--glycine ligase n=1 Tax=Pilibacter termitis TaxID=263852 RepID=A0A1T4P0E9_9ENTE|nr:phosphoribosylamine--glycine ligase [Pilibacter termitis]SJZ84911.1 phosphoribosylamine--glycine ligase [Pilibacter termitis]